MVEDEHADTTGNGLPQCPWCGDEIHGKDPVTSSEGVDYEHAAVCINSNPTATVYCQSCYSERETERRQEENKGLDNYV